MAKQFLPDVFGRHTGGDVFSGLRREIDRVFSDFGRGMPALGNFGKDAMSLKVNVAETDKTVEVTAEIPGVEAKDMDIQLKDGMLTIKGEKKEEKDEKQKDYHLLERSYGMFQRSFTLPAEVDDEKVEASFNNGLLKVVLQKTPAAASKGKKIEIKSTQT